MDNASTVYFPIRTEITATCNELNVSVTADTATEAIQKCRAECIRKVRKMVEQEKING